MNMEGAVAGMIVGITFTAAYIIYFKFMGGTPDQYWFGISPEGIGTLGMLVNLFTAFSPLKCRMLSGASLVPNQAREDSSRG